MPPEPLITSLDEDEVRWARETPRAEKFIAGARLFDYACSITLAGIKRRNPDASEQEALAILRERLDWASKWD
jgi:hypothetical protein